MILEFRDGNRSDDEDDSHDNQEFNQAKTFTEDAHVMLPSIKRARLWCAHPDLPCSNSQRFCAEREVALAIR